MQLDFDFKRASMLARAIAKGRSVCLSVRLSVYHTREPRLNGSRCRNTFYTIRCFSVLEAKFRRCKFRGSPRMSVLKRDTPVESENLTNNVVQ